MVGLVVYCCMLCVVSQCFINGIGLLTNRYGQAATPSTSCLLQTICAIARRIHVQSEVVAVDPIPSLGQPVGLQQFGEFLLWAL